MSAMLAGGSPPDLILNRHCGECEFRDGCRQKALEKDDLSLLGGMTEKERKKLHAQRHLHRHATLLHLSASQATKAAARQT